MHGSPPRAGDAWEALRTEHPMWPKPPGTHEQVPVDFDGTWGGTGTTAGDLGALRRQLADLQATCTMRSMELAEERAARANLEAVTANSGAPAISPMTPSSPGSSDDGRLRAEHRRMQQENEGLRAQIEALMRQVQDLLNELRMRPTKDDHARLQVELKKAQAELEVRPARELQWNLTAEMDVLRAAAQASADEAKSSEESAAKLAADLAKAQDRLSEFVSRETEAELSQAAEKEKWIGEVLASQKAQLELQDALQ
mmetsp:Transcript_33478/g.96077  ORF Transcript_33478/g.96077 Transcript_33478/m.96077 type:complete len:256 (-) Transcript_33478:10-777(-)